jgi:type I restriction enzyme M protein
MTSSAIVQKLWNYCNVLRDDGMSYGDYVEQLTYLLFLKMADEAALQPAQSDSQRVQLVEPAQEGWRRPVWPLPSSA